MKCQARHQWCLQQEMQLGGECFAQAIAFEAMGNKLQPDELVNLFGVLEIEML